MLVTVVCFLGCVALVVLAVPWVIEGCARYFEWVERVAMNKGCSECGRAVVYPTKELPEPEKSK